jgi:hypothetical protein
MLGDAAVKVTKFSDGTVLPRTRILSKNRPPARVLDHGIVLGSDDIIVDRISTFTFPSESATPK